MMKESQDGRVLVSFPPVPLELCDRPGVFDGALSQSTTLAVVGLAVARILPSGVGPAHGLSVLVVDDDWMAQLSSIAETQRQAAALSVAVGGAPANWLPWMEALAVADWTRPDLDPLRQSTPNGFPRDRKTLCIGFERVRTLVQHLDGSSSTNEEVAALLLMAALLADHTPDEERLVAAWRHVVELTRGLRCGELLPPRHPQVPDDPRQAAYDVDVSTGQVLVDSLILGL